MRKETKSVSLFVSIFFRRERWGMFRLAIYGKGGIGKSTTAGNIALSLAQMGNKVMLIGCDPKADSTFLVMKGNSIPTVLNCMREKEKVELSDIVHQSPSGVLCVEAGGPIPGVGCAGRGITAAFDLLENLDAYGKYQPDYVIYDVLGDVVCGGFAMPLRGKYSDAAYVVTSGEMMSLYAASNILRALESFKARDYARFAGLIVNLKNIEDEKQKLERFCSEENVSVVASIPRSPEILRAEDKNMTVVEFLPDSLAAQRYRDLAGHIVKDASNG